MPSAQGFVHADVSAAVAALAKTLPVLDEYFGMATIAGYTVLHGRAQVPRAVALVDTPSGQRVLTSSEDPMLIARLESEEYVGRLMRVDGTQLSEAKRP